MLTIDPDLGLDLIPARTLRDRPGSVTVLIPAHNERATVAEVVTAARQGLDRLDVTGEVLVSASGCTDDTAVLAATAGARVIDAPLGKGAAITAGLLAARGDIVCLIDGDLRYFGDPPLVTLLCAPILRGQADACIADLYWRPIYPQLWSHGFFAPLAGLLFPELLAKAGTTPWSGQRAALRSLWPATLPADFTVDLALLLAWNDNAARLRPVLADDWTNPQRPKPDLIAQEFDTLVTHAITRGRISPTARPALADWFAAAHHRMAAYEPGTHDPQEFERQLLRDSLAELHRRVGPAQQDARPRRGNRVQ